MSTHKIEKSDLNEIEIQEVEYLNHDGRSLLARITRPRNIKACPAIVELHGGTWVMGDRTVNNPITSQLARRGICVASLDFRAPPDGVYPNSVADVNYGVRWLKSHAGAFGAAPGTVGIMGSSSGGHLALLSSMRPNDPRYTSIQSADLGKFDATVPYVVALWPVICPLQRHQYLSSGGSLGDRVRSTEEMLRNEDIYWGEASAMSEGSPLLALERGEDVVLPKILYVQNEDDKIHPWHLADRFVSEFRARGGDITELRIRGERYDDLRVNAGSETSAVVFDKVAKFIHLNCKGN